MRRIDDLERAAARHWQAPEQERLGEWLLRAAEGFTGRANSALPLGDPGLPLPEAVAYVTDWYRRRRLTPMIVVPLPLADARRHRLDNFLAKRAWLLRSGPAFVMTAAVADVPAPALHTGVHLDPEPDPGWLAAYRYRGQELPPIARPLLMSAPWQAFASVRRAGPDAPRPLGVALTSALAAAAADRGANRILLQVETANTPARALYARCGFRDSHRYHYRMAPTG